MFKDRLLSSSTAVDSPAAPQLSRAGLLQRRRIVQFIDTATTSNNEPTPPNSHWWDKFLLSRRSALKLAGVAGITLAAVELSDGLRGADPFPISYEGIPEENNRIQLSEETLKHGIRVVVFGDSIPYGFQGNIEDDSGNVMYEFPATSFAHFIPSGLPEDVQKRWSVEMQAVQGEPSYTTLKKIQQFKEKEYRKRKEAKEKGIPVDERPLLIYFSTNGNDMRDPASDPSLSTEVQAVHGNLAQGAVFDVKAAADRETLFIRDNIYNALLALNDMTDGIPPENINSEERYPVPVLAVSLLLPYDKSTVDHVKFIPSYPANHAKAQAEQRFIERNGRQVLQETTLFLDDDWTARFGLHVTSVDQERAYREALFQFRSLGKTFDNKLVAIPMGNLIKFSNGTEHLSPEGCRELAILAESYIDTSRNGRAGTFDKLYPPESPPPQLPTPQIVPAVDNKA